MEVTSINLLSPVNSMLAASSINEIVSHCHQQAKNAGLSDKPREISRLLTELELAAIQSSLRHEMVDLSKDSKFDVKYMAGLMDGEGHIGLNKNIMISTSGKKWARYIIRVQIVSKDFEIIEPLTKLGGKIEFDEKSKINSKHSDIAKWNIHGHEAIRFLRWVEPHMNINRKKIVARLVYMLDFLKSQPAGNKANVLRLPIQESIYRALTYLNSGSVRTITPDQCNQELLDISCGWITSYVEKQFSDLMDGHLPGRKMFEVELADAVIRIFDLAGREGIDLGGALVEKLAYNLNRADHKLENRELEGGKRY